MNTDLINYYKQRANEYEKIYSKPERQQAILEATTLLQSIFKNKSLNEIACGTGFWTEKISKTAASILATDINAEVIEIAQKKEIKNRSVHFKIEDFYNVDPNKKHESLFGGFIFSHVLKQDVAYFFNTIHKLIEPNGTIVLMDNNFVEGSNLPITNTDEEGNTFQTRLLEDGTTHLVLKNFPTQNYFRGILKDIATDLKFTNLNYFWILSYKIRA